MSTVTLVDTDGTQHETDVPYVGPDVLISEHHYVAPFLADKDAVPVRVVRRRYALCQCPALDRFHYHEVME